MFIQIMFTWCCFMIQIYVSTCVIQILIHLFNNYVSNLSLARESHARQYMSPSMRQSLFVLIQIHRKYSCFNYRKEVLGWSEASRNNCGIVCQIFRKLKVTAGSKKENITTPFTTLVIISTFFVVDRNQLHFLRYFSFPLSLMTQICC